MNNSAESTTGNSADSSSTTRQEQQYAEALALARSGRYDDAERGYRTIAATAPGPLMALVQNDLAVLAALQGRHAEARQLWETALVSDPDCAAALQNLHRRDDSRRCDRAGEMPIRSERRSRPRIAILSLLFNWPSTGGGNVHTIELASALTMAGYDVKHLFARYVPWLIGQFDGTCPFPSEALSFDEPSWRLPLIQQRFRDAVEAINPDFVLITDTWNLKPYLAEAVRDFRYILRFDALECLCPLNNLRQLPHSPTDIRSCSRHRLATPHICQSCVAELGLRSSLLHQVERAMSGFTSDAYHALLERALKSAETVLVVNPLIAAHFEPYTQSVRVVTPGVDVARFSQTTPLMSADGGTIKKLLFAGRVVDPTKGFHVLREAAARLWEVRQDFCVVATNKPLGPPQPYLDFRDWTRYEQMPALFEECTLLVAPATAPESFGLTPIEAMAAGRPVVASRIGGLQFSILDEVTGLLFEPGSAADLAAKLSTLLDDPRRCRQMGEAGRARVQQQFTWPAIIARHYDPLFRSALA